MITLEDKAAAYAEQCSRRDSMQFLKIKNAFVNGYKTGTAETKQEILSVAKYLHDEWVAGNNDGVYNALSMLLNIVEK